LTRVPAERAARLLYLLGVFGLLAMGGCGGGAGPSSPAPVASAISVTVSPTTASVQVELNQSFTTTVANDGANKGVTWALSGMGCSGTACGVLSAASSASGVAVTYTAPAIVPNPPSVTLTAKSVTDGTKTAVAAITVTAPAPVISVTLSLTTASVAAGGTQSFTAAVANDSQNKGVSWSLSSTGCSGGFCGTLSSASSASGGSITYTAPAVAPSPPAVRLTATSVADGSKSASAAITVTTGPVIGLGISPMTASVQADLTHTFLASVTNDSQNKGVSWTLSGAGCSGVACGTVTPTTSASNAPVTYTAPTSVPTPAMVTLTATSITDNTKFVAAAITVTAPASVSLTPKRGGLALGQSLNFTATVTNDIGAAGVMWSATTSTFSAQTSTSATYVAPSSPGSVKVTATSIADGTKTASATIGVTDLAGVTTYHNDLSRDGANVQEYALNSANVKAATFGKLFSCTVEGAVYAQPLWVPNVNIGGGTHNVIVVATMRDWVYVFDADASPCTMYWSSQLIPSGETYGNNGDVGTNDIYQDLGITGTPVIDPSTNTIYLVAKTKTISNGNYHSRLFALKLETGAKMTTEVDIAASVPGNCDGGTTVSFSPQWQNQRPGLALVNGVVYVGYGSHGDDGNWHGWLLGYQASNLNQVGVFNTTPNALSPPVAAPAPPCGAGIWMAGGAPAADATNHLYVTTGNGAYDGVTDYGDSYVKLNTPGLTFDDSFTPANQSSLDMNDTDVGSSGTALLIDQTNGPVHLMVGASKASVFFVLNRDSMGGFHGSGDTVVQEFGLDGASFSTPGFWNNNAYYFGTNFNSTLAGESFAFTNGTFGSTATHHTPSKFGFAGATPSISASSATTDGIVWAIDSGAYGTSDFGSSAAGPAVLHAFDASNISNELWNSAQAAGERDTAGNAVKFTVPTVANGKVYIGTRGSDDTLGKGSTSGELDVYGLLPN
jgi:acyl-coenzyme A thioesterase PaaI-like protein